MLEVFNQLKYSSFVYCKMAQVRCLPIADDFSEGRKPIAAGRHTLKNGSPGLSECEHRKNGKETAGLNRRLRTDISPGTLRKPYGLRPLGEPWSCMTACASSYACNFRIIYIMPMQSLHLDVPLIIDQPESAPACQLVDLKAVRTELL